MDSPIPLWFWPYPCLYPSHSPDGMNLNKLFQNKNSYFVVSSHPSVFLHCQFWCPTILICGAPGISFQKFTAFSNFKRNPINPWTEIISFQKQRGKVIELTDNIIISEKWKNNVSDFFQNFIWNNNNRRRRRRRRGGGEEEEDHL